MRALRDVRWLIALLAVGGTACRPGPLPEVGFWTINCTMQPGESDALEFTVIVDAVGAATPSQLLVRLDSLHSTEGPQYDLPSGFIAHVALRSGPGQGCGNTTPAGVELWVPGDQLVRAWVHLKSDSPASVTVMRGDGSVVAGPVMAEVGAAVPPIRWGEQ